jgi:hypothetical protein
MSAGRLRVVLALALVAVGCGRAEVQIYNQSSVRLLDMFISGGGDRVKVDFVEPTGRRRTLLCPAGKVGSFEVSFTARGQEYKSVQTADFECDGSYSIRLDVSPQFEVRSTVDVR